MEKKSKKSAKRGVGAPGKLIQSQKMAMVGQMASGVAHEINTPLGTIALLAGELKSAFAEKRVTQEMAAEILTDIEAAAMRISQITNGLRAIARDSSKDSFVFASLREIVESTLVLCQSRFANHGVEFQVCEIPPGVELECHPAQIGQIVLNLLSNAFDAVVDLPEKWIRMDFLDTKEKIKLSVTDSGSGIPAEVREKMFQPFFTTKDSGSGTGLGLSIVRSLVDAHGGEIRLNQESQNTQFVVELPKHQLF